MSQTVKVLRKVGILLVAVPLFIVGVILIPLPGPGLLVCFAALFLLSLEFDWAKPYLERVKREVNNVAERAKGKPKKSTKQSTSKKTK